MEPFSLDQQTGFSMTTQLRIGDLAKLTDCQVETIRFYERQGLLPAPSRSENNYRVYGDEHLERLTFIRHCRLLSMGHDEIKTLLAFREEPAANCAGVNEMLDAHIIHVANRIAELKTLEKYLKQLRSLCVQAHETQHCGILRSIGSSNVLNEKLPVNARTIAHGRDSVHSGFIKPHSHTKKN